MTLTGFILTASAAFMWASSNIVVRFAVRAAPGYQPFGFIVWSSLFPILPFALLALFIDGPERVQQQLQGLSLAAVASVLYLAWLATLLAYTLWTRLLHRHAAAGVVPFSLLVPVVGLAAAASAFGERPNALQWWGTAAVLLGLAINQGFGAVVRRLALARS
jgi:O-acetylserine/cysteine efflux transporter